MDALPAFTKCKPSLVARVLVNFQIPPKLPLSCLHQAIQVNMGGHFLVSLIYIAVAPPIYVHLPLFVLL